MCIRDRDKAAFDTLMEEQKTRARKAREALGDLGWSGVEFGKDMPATQFLGYESHSAQGKVLALVAGEELREELGTGAEGILVLDQTPFYACLLYTSPPAHCRHHRLGQVGVHQLPDHLTAL